MGLIDSATTALFNKAVQTQYHRLVDLIKGIRHEIRTSEAAWDTISFKLDQFTNRFSQLEATMRAQHGLCMVSGTSKMYFQHGPGEPEGEDSIRDTPIGDFRMLPPDERYTFKFQFPVAINDLQLSCSPNCVIVDAVHNGTIVIASGSSVQRIAIPDMASHDILTVTIQRVY